MVASMASEEAACLIRNITRCMDKPWVEVKITLYVDYKPLLAWVAAELECYPGTQAGSGGHSPPEAGGVHTNEYVYSGAFE